MVLFLALLAFFYGVLLTGLRLCVVLSVDVDFVVVSEIAFVRKAK